MGKTNKGNKLRRRRYDMARVFTVFALGLALISFILSIASMINTAKAKGAASDALVNSKIRIVQNTVPMKVDTEDKPQLKSLGIYTATAYCPCRKCCGKSDGITASGTRATAGRTIAADTSKLPFGTKVYINGHEYVVEDRGGAIKGNKIDIFFSSHAEALKYGKKKVELFIER